MVNSVSVYSVTPTQINLWLNFMFLGKCSSNNNKVSPFKGKSCPVNHLLYNHLGQVTKTLFKLSFPEWIEMGWHVFSFDSVESVTHNGWFYTCTTHVRCIKMWVGEAGGTNVKEIIFHNNTKTYCHFCLMVQASVILFRNQIWFSMH